MWEKKIGKRDKACPSPQKGIAMSYKGRRRKARGENECPGQGPDWLCMTL